MLSAKNKVVITIFGVLAVIIFLMYVLDRSSNKRVERFKDTEEEEEEDVDDVKHNDEEEEEEEMVPKSKPSKKTHEKLPIANEKTMKETSIPSGKDEELILEEPVPGNNDDVVSYVSKWVSGLNIPSSLKTETFKELFSEENIEKMKSMVSVQQAKDWVGSIVSSLNNNKEAFATTVSQRRTINQLKDKLRQMENDLNDLMDDLDEVSKKDTTVKRGSSRDYVSFGPSPAPASSSRVSRAEIPTFDSTSTRRAVNDSEISINSLPSVNQENKSASRLTDKDPLFAKNSDTVSSSIGKKLTVGGNNIIEGFENVSHNFALY